jgi:tRNA(fMet)-specific endonuclease VapC
MILLDTDHLPALKYRGTPARDRLIDRMTVSPDQAFAVSIVSVEEQFRGWMAAIARFRKVEQQVPPYTQLLELFQFFSRWTILPFDVRAAIEFERLRDAGVRIGTMDLKIAATALVHNATLLTANRRDFEQVPGLKFEDWLK